MKFGLEAEKFIFDMQSLRPSENVFSILDALSDFEWNIYHALGDKKTTNEFVLNMVEFGTTPSSRPLEVLKDYLFSYLMIRSVAAREQIYLAPLAALPMDYLPRMTPKRAYYVQNSVLSGRLQPDWLLDSSSPLKAAGNCAGVHVHGEIETPHEFLFSNDELKDKFNMGLMLTPMIAFSSSPYFYSVHEAKSMRGLRYYEGVYKNFPLNGGLPPVAASSIDVLDFMRSSGEHWMKEGVTLGFSREEMEHQVAAKGANWNPVRWNARWNTIEIRCFDSDFFEQDASKFIWVCGAMGRMDIKGEGLRTRILETRQWLDLKMIGECFEVHGGEVTVLPSGPLKQLFERACRFGTKDDLVEAYLHRLADFSKAALGKEERWLFDKGLRNLETHQTTSERLLAKTGGKARISARAAEGLVAESISQNDQSVDALKRQVPEIFRLLDTSSGEGIHV